MLDLQPLIKAFDELSTEYHKTWNYFDITRIGMDGREWKDNYRMAPIEFYRAQESGGRIIRMHTDVMMVSVIKFGRNTEVSFSTFKNFPDKILLGQLIDTANETKQLIIQNFDKNAKAKLESEKNARRAELQKELDLLNND